MSSHWRAGDSPWHGSACTPFHFQDSRLSGEKSNHWRNHSSREYMPSVRTFSILNVLTFCHDPLFWTTYELMFLVYLEQVFCSVVKRLRWSPLTWSHTQPSWEQGIMVQILWLTLSDTNTTLTCKLFLYQVVLGSAGRRRASGGGKTLSPWRIVRQFLATQEFF